MTCCHSIAFRLGFVWTMEIRMMREGWDGLVLWGQHVTSTDAMRHLGSMLISSLHLGSVELESSRKTGRILGWLRALSAGLTLD